MSGAFGFWQPEYAARGLSTFPVRFVLRGGKHDKVPAVSGYMKLGIRGSTALAPKFEHFDTLGLTCGRRNRLTIVDVDSQSENIVGDVMGHYGPSPLVSRTPSGGHHVYYRYEGERRRIRDRYWRNQNVAVDVLGNGFVVAPPSRGPKGDYRFIQGTLDDVEHLPVIQRPPLDCTADEEAVREGLRNDQLFRHCMKCAAQAESLDEVIKEAHSFNARCLPALEEREVVRTAGSAWKYEVQGLNRYGRHGAWFPLDELESLITDQDALVLLAYLRAYNGPRSRFMCTNGLSERLHWSRRRVPAARNRLIERDYIRCVAEAGQGHAALYIWGNAASRKGVRS